MKLYIYDQKHEQIVEELNLGDSFDVAIVKKIIDFLDEQKMTDRYSTLVLAEDYSISYDEEFPEITFVGRE